jgi:hypothetical protein
LVGSKSAKKSSFVDDNRSGYCAICDDDDDDDVMTMKALVRREADGVTSRV